MRTSKFKLISGIAVIGLLGACNGSLLNEIDGNNIDGPVIIAPPPPVIAAFQVTITNLTNAQPLSPVALIVHQTEFGVFELGAPASVALETLAEGGDNAELLSLADGNAIVYTTASGAGPIPPGQNDVISFEIEEPDIAAAYFSVSTMLVNTNDAFTGVNTVDLAGLDIGDTLIRRGVAYDAGTEADDEMAIYIPGPAGGGEGFNTERDDENDAVSMHPGVVTSHDGLVTSALNGQHKFDNPVIQVRIERIQ